MDTWLWVILVLIPFVAVLIYYLTEENRKRAYYRKSETRWKKFTPSDMDMVKYSVFLIGDAGAPSLKQPDRVLSLLHNKLLAASDKSGIIFLGDNIYPTGLPTPTSPEHERAERRLLKSLEALSGYKGKSWFISGNHDWNKGKKGGFETMLRQQLYIETYLNRRDVYLPRDGCPGPVEVEVNDQLTIIFINTQWWVHNGHRPIGKANGCKAESEHEFFQLLDELLEKNENKRVLVIGHHPVYSASHHGGHFSLKQHFFPLTSVHKHLYVPLPIAGSLFPMYRKYFGSKEDMSHPKYKNMRKRLMEIFSKYDHLIYASGHDHNLQYIQKKNQHYLVSGSGSKVHHIQEAEDAKFAHAHKGFMKLDFMYSGEVWLEVWEPSPISKDGILAYRKVIIPPSKS